MKEKIYLLPGFMCDERLWGKLTPYLDEYELVHVPLPLDDNFDEINKSLDEVFKEEKVNLLGFSLGGYISSYFTLKNPDRVKRLFLISATAGATSKQDIEKRERKINSVKQKGFRELSYKKSASLLEEQNQNNEELIKVLQDMFNDLGEEVFVTHLTSTLHRQNLVEDMAKLDIPINFFYSDNDRLLNHGFIKTISEKNKKNICLVSREGTSHNIPLEDEKGLAVNIKNWMKR